jgi:transposase
LEHSHGNASLIGRLLRRRVRAPELNPVENIWQYLRQNWLSNRVFENYDAIIDAACDAWRRLVEQPETNTSIGMREWAHIGQTS